MRRSGWVPVVLLAAGIVLVVDAVVRGTASVALVAIVPVISGSSAEFLVGVVLLLAGFLALPLAFFSWAEPNDATLPHDARFHGETPTEEVGGVLLVGPVPIFFGSWKEVSLRTKVAVAVVGAIVLVVLVVAFVLALR
jgi:uncharacterized protein (TIGR00304 family)